MGCFDWNGWEIFQISHPLLLLKFAYLENILFLSIFVRLMSKSLPESEEEMLRIPHVTKANFDKYGHSLLDVTQRFAAQKLGEFNS